jgi:hypothetical protein
MLLIVALVIVALAGVLAWFVIGRLSSDAIAMAIGLAIGVFSLFPAGWALSLGRARDAEDDYAGQDYIDVQPIYRVMQLPALP